MVIAKPNTWKLQGQTLNIYTYFLRSLKNTQLKIFTAQTLKAKFHSRGWVWGEKKRGKEIMDYGVA